MRFYNPEAQTDSYVTSCTRSTEPTRQMRAESREYRTANRRHLGADYSADLCAFPLGRCSAQGEWKIFLKVYKRKPSFERCRAHQAAASRVSRVSARSLVRWSRSATGGFAFRATAGHAAPPPPYLTRVGGRNRPSGPAGLGQVLR